VRGTLNFFAIQEKRDRPVIDEMDLHLGLKLPCLNGDALFFPSLNQTFVEGFGNGGLFCVGERGPSPFLAIPIKGELRDDQHLPVHLFQGEVELPGSVFEDSEVGDFRDHIGEIALVISLPHSDEYQKAFPDLSSQSAIHQNLSGLNPLDHCFHIT
jgi:hypothetical protein